jgi:hypothetical protein
LFARNAANDEEATGGTAHPDVVPSEASTGLGKLTLAQVIEKFSLDEKTARRK